MILEHALLRVRAGEERDFEVALVKAKPLISASSGFVAMDVRRACEEPGLYILLVHWDSIEDHRDGFRLSDRYVDWRNLLHPFYDALPKVTYFGAPL